MTIGGPKVIGFGIAPRLGCRHIGGLTSTGAVIGSPGFMSPETDPGRETDRGERRRCDGGGAGGLETGPGDDARIDGVFLSGRIGL
ncbi:hypothetical protein OG735_40085 [Streptomyces sp. NBC_01210]|uniref:hypothetical protein n=1 Tax=Streptomyces sp. NBC_01210 TaxID=2903774 RepID=UPI003FA384F0|nr:hypothetical protein OG735_40085 [Streptomyces sp. NBC_01210]